MKVKANLSGSKQLKDNYLKSIKCKSDFISFKL